MHRSTDGIGAPTFTDIDLSVMSVNVGAPVSSVHLSLGDVSGQ
jgi:hypothetical protein